MYEDLAELSKIQNRAKDLEMAARELRLAAIARETALQFGSSNEKQKTLVNLIEKKDAWGKVLISDHITEAEYQEALGSWRGRKAKKLLTRAMTILRSLI